MFRQFNEELIQNLARAHIIKDPAVKAAMLAVDRGHFSRYKPYEDAPQTIGHQSTISAPHMHAAALESLSPIWVKVLKVTADVLLDIGSGSGYLTVCMAHMVGPTGRVVGVEHIPELVEQSKKNTAKDQPSFLEEGRVAFFAADGRVGFPQEAPYDCIHVGAAAESMHKELVEQLKAPGRMFIPVSDRAGQGIYVVDKDKNGRVTKSRTMDVWYVPLTDVQTQYER